MLRQQLAFIKEHEDVLQLGELRPLYPNLLYPIVIARTDRKMVVAFYADMPVRLNEELPPELFLVNGSYAPEVLVELAQDLGRVEVKAVDCCGSIIGTESLDLVSGMNRLKVPPAAHLHIRRSGK